jgi:hypothetical protein
MWAIRILTGEQAGQVIPLSAGAQKIGRGTSCEIKLASAAVSKEHAQVHVTEDKVIVSDLNSRNGTYVNGVRIQRQLLKQGDKVALHDVIFDLLSIASVQALPGARPAGPFAAGTGQLMGGPGSATGRPSARSGSVAGQALSYTAADYADPRSAARMSSQARDQDPDEGEAEAPRFAANSLPDLWRALMAYVDSVAMPGAYALAKKAPFRLVIGGYVAGFVFLVTLLSTIPMTTAMRESMQAESQRRALTIARNLSVMNRQAIVDGLEVSVNTQMAENEDGVESALVIAAKDGRVIAPAGRAGAYADKPYILRVRKKVRNSDELNEREYVEQIDSTKIVAAVPIKKFSAEGSGQSVAAYAVVVYNISSLAIEQGETLVLLGQNFLIAIVLGLILYWFLAKTIEHPVVALNAQLDDALREGKDDIFVEFQFPELAQLAANVNSALSRIGQLPSSSAAGAAAAVVDRDAEAAGIARAIGGPAIAINAIDSQIVAANEAFVALIPGVGSLERRPLSDISDQALRDHLRSLIERARESPGSPATDEIPFPDGAYASAAMAVSGGSQPAYFLIILRKRGEEGG